MDTTYTKGNPFNIIFVGRLVPEKGTQVLLECMKTTLIHERFSEMIHWHIVGNGDDMPLFQKIKSRFPEHITLYGKLEPYAIDQLRGMMHLSIVPSLFLETFGLIAIESISQGIPVCGFKKGGLIPFISDSLDLNPKNPIDSFLSILDDIFTNGFDPLPNIESFNANLWREELKKLTQDVTSILIIHDYLIPLGGAEHYIMDLKKELTAIGKRVYFFGYHGPLPQWKRIWFLMITLLAVWRKADIKKAIYECNPDLIWLHSVTRFIGPWGVQSVIDSKKKSIITHHDLGLITARPSNTQEESDIMQHWNLGEFVGHTYSPIEYFARTIKFFLLKWYWHYIGALDDHLVPSDFMKPHFENLGAKHVKIFRHKQIQ